MDCMSRLGTFLRMHREQRRALVEAGCLLSVARFAVSFIPFRWIVAFLGRYRTESPAEDQPRHLPAIRQVFWAIRVMSRNLPWKNTCLVQAMAGQWMLRRRGVPGTLYLGLARDQESGELLAHAWLRSGQKMVTGGNSLDRGYTVVGSFSGGGGSGS